MTETTKTFEALLADMVKSGEMDASSARDIVFAKSNPDKVRAVREGKTKTVDDAARIEVRHREEYTVKATGQVKTGPAQVSVKPPGLWRGKPYKNVWIRADIAATILADVDGFRAAMTEAKAENDAAADE